MFRNDRYIFHYTIYNSSLDTRRLSTRFSCTLFWRQYGSADLSSIICHMVVPCCPVEWRCRGMEPCSSPLLFPLLRKQMCLCQPWPGACSKTCHKTASCYIRAGEGQFTRLTASILRMTKRGGKAV